VADDVRIRLSAEGVEDVVNAMKEVKESAVAAGEEGSAAFEKFRDVMGDIGKEFLGFLVLDKIIEQAHDLFGEVLNGARTLDKLHESTGLSTDALQALGDAAEEAHVSQDSLNSGLQILTRTLGQAEDGSKKGAAALHLVGLSVKDLQGMNADQIFQTVAQRLMDIQNPAERAAAGTALFGRAFGELQPVIADVSKDGFDPFIEKMKENGVYLSGDAIEQMKAAQNGLHEIGEEAKGLATEFMEGFVPQMESSFDSVTQALGVGGDGNGLIYGFQVLGQIVGAVITSIVNGFMEVGVVVGTAVAQVITYAGAAKQALGDIAQGNFSGAGSTMSGANKTWGDMNTRADAQLAILDQGFSNAWGRVGSNPKSTGAAGATGIPSTGSFNGQDDQASSQAHLQLIKAQLDAEQAQYEAHSKLMEAQNQAAYEAGKISLQQYYGARRSIIEGQTNEEVSVLQRERAAISASPLGDSPGASDQRQAELARIDGEIASKKLDAQTQLMQMTGEERKAQQDNYQKSLAAEQKLLELEGDKAGAAKLKLEADLQDLQTQLQASGASQGDINRALDSYKTKANASIDFSDTKDSASAAMSSLQTAIKQIQDAQKNGQLFPVQAEEQIINLEKQRLPVLRQMADQMLRLAQASGDDGQIAQAEQFSEKVQELAQNTDQAGQQMAKLKTTAQDAFQGGLSNFLYDAATGTKTLGQAFDNMALSFVEALAKMEAQYLASQALKWLTGAASGGGGSSASSIIGVVAGIASHFAVGGAVRGPGSSTSDSIPAMLSDGEFVVNARAAGQPGVMAILHAINGTPGYARSVGPAVSHYASGGAVSGGGAAVNHYHIDASGIDPHLINQAVHEQVLNVIAKNPARVRQAIG